MSLNTAEARFADMHLHWAFMEAQERERTPREYFLPTKLTASFREGHRRLCFPGEEVRALWRVLWADACVPAQRSFVRPPWGKKHEARAGRKNLEKVKAVSLLDIRWCHRRQLALEKWRTEWGCRWETAVSTLEIGPTEPHCDLDPGRRGGSKDHILPEVLRNYNRRGSVILKVKGPPLSGNKLSFYFHSTPSNVWWESGGSGGWVFLQMFWGVGATQEADITWGPRGGLRVSLCSSLPGWPWTTPTVLCTCFHVCKMRAQDWMHSFLEYIFLT